MLNERNRQMSLNCFIENSKKGKHPATEDTLVLSKYWREDGGSVGLCVCMCLCVHACVCALLNKYSKFSFCSNERFWTRWRWKFYSIRDGLICYKIYIIKSSLCCTFYVKFQFKNKRREAKTKGKRKGDIIGKEFQYILEDMNSLEWRKLYQWDWG